MSEHTGQSYESIAAKYAAMVDMQPWNAYYERPAVVSLLPPLKGARVLDAGCGSGWYTEYLIGQGADVTAVDLNEEFVALTRKRLGERARVLQGDLSKPLTFAEQAEFDLVVCPLVMHYMKDWGPTLGEFFRVLKPGGVLVFSTHHPFMDWKQFNTENYFTVDLLEDEWPVGKVSFYRRPLTAISQALWEAGFAIERLLEPRPTEDFRHANPEAYERLSKNPWFVVFRAGKLALV